MKRTENLEGKKKKKKQEITSIGENVEKREPLYTVGNEISADSMEKYEVLQKIENRTTI